MTGMSISSKAPAKQIRKQVAGRLRRAVHQHSAFSRAGLSELFFAQLFKGLVYPQIWEDPEIDMAAMRIAPGDRIVTIASGGCNALSYLVADPSRVEAVDLNPTHVAFNRLKLAALANLPDQQAFFRFYGDADHRDNIPAYTSFVRPHLDQTSRAYWDGRSMTGRRRISIFARGLYSHGLLGRFIGWGHKVARLYGVDPRGLLLATTMEEQRRFFDQEIAPLFDKRALRWAIGRKSSLFGLGIPPQQYDALSSAGEGGMASIVRSRLEKLACDFPVAENYFAWQAFGRGYSGPGGSLPPYLSPENFETVRARVSRVSIDNASFADFLAAKPEKSVEHFVLLDAQDWMSDERLNELWREITRTAAPGACVIFRTAAEESPLPGRVAAALLDRWDYHEAESRDLHARDRSSIYGGFHIYRLKESRR